MKLTTLSFIFLLASITFFSCQSVDEAGAVADQFFEAYNNQDEATMESILDKESVLDAGIKDEFYNVFDKQWQGFGKVESYKRYSFQTKTNNGITTVVLRFSADTEKGGELFIKLMFVKRSDGYKVIVYEYNTDKSIIDITEE
jgi:hypothetical protein